MAEPKLKLAKVKVLSVSDKSFDGNEGEKVKCWEIVLQSEEDTSQVVTGKVYKVLDERVKQGEVVENVWVYEDMKGDRVQTNFFFPKQGSGGGGKGGGRTYGKTDAELKLMRKDLLTKLYSTHMSYVKDILIATEQGEFPWDDWYEKSKVGAMKMIVDLKEIAGE